MFTQFRLNLRHNPSFVTYLYFITKVLEANLPLPMSVWMASTHLASKQNILSSSLVTLSS